MLSDLQRKTACESLHSELKEFVDGVLPLDVPTKSSAIVAIKMAAIVMHPDGSMSVIGLQGSKSKDLQTLIESDHFEQACEQPDERESWTEEHQRPHDYN